MLLARGRYFVFAFFLILASGVFTALPAAAASVSETAGGITYTADDVDVPAGARVTGFAGSGAVTIPDTIEIGGTDYDVVAIGPSVFRNTGVTAVTIGNKVTSIGSYAFYDNQIVSLNLGSSVVSIGDGAFRTNQLTSLTIPDTVVSIGDHAFNDNQIATLDLGSNVVSIGAGVFRGNQLTEVTFPASIESIGELAFVENAGLQSVVFAGTAPTVTGLVSGNRTFPANVPAAAISYPWSEDVVNGGGFSAPTWQGYTSAAIRGEFTVTFDANGHGSTPPAAQTVLEGEPASAPTPTPTDPDWAFTGWFTDSDGTDSFNFVDPISEDTTLYAGWKMPAGLPQADVTVTISTACPLPPELEGDDEPVYMQWSNVMYSYGFSGSRPLAPDTVVSGGYVVGEWHLQASIEGYQDLDAVVAVTEDGPNDFTFVMDPEGYDGNCDSGLAPRESDPERKPKDLAADILPATGSSVGAAMLLGGLLLTLGGTIALTHGRRRMM